MKRLLSVVFVFAGTVALSGAECGKCDNVCGDRGRENCIVIQDNCSQKCQGWEDKGEVAAAPIADA